MLMDGISLKELLNHLYVKDIHGDIKGLVKGIAYHTDKVEDGTLFFALPGTRAKGWEYAGAAVEKGALAVVTGMEAPILGFPQIRTSDVRQAISLLASCFYGNPADEMRLIGVTGTNGKTTITHLIDTILRETGLVTGLIGTVSYMVAGEVTEPLSTTPEASDLQALFANMREKEVSHAVMEVSSHALELQRVAGSEFDTAVLTNITADHLDFHNDFESYRRAKTKLFSQMGGSFLKNNKPRVAIINADDASFPYISARTPVQQITYGLKGEADLLAENPVTDLKGISYRLKSFAGNIDIKLRLRGTFNIYNSLAAIAVGLTEGIDIKDIAAILEEVEGVSGRFEQIDCGQDYLVVVDYAHTADGLDNVLQTARQLLASGKLITVFGCGGDRDRTKRPLMGEMAGKYSDICVITSDNPRGEDPEEIVKDIIPGLEKKKKRDEYYIEIERGAAIKKALSLAKKGDIVLIAGKGHEDYQVFKDKTIHFSDQETVRDILSV